MRSSVDAMEEQPDSEVDDLHGFQLWVNWGQMDWQDKS